MNVEKNTTSTISMRHCFNLPSPHYPNLGQLDGQQCNSVRVHPYAYPQHMNMLKHFLCIKYMSTGHCFTPSSPHYPNLGQLDGQQCNSARVHPYAYPQHMNMLKHFPYIQYGCGEEVSGVVQPQPCHCVIVCPTIPRLPKSGSTWPAM
jgi:hypothetical protein